MASNKIKGAVPADHAVRVSPPDDDPVTSEFEALLIAFDEGLASGSTVNIPDLRSLPLELSSELRDAQDCLWLLHAASRAGQLDDLASDAATRRTAVPTTLESIDRIGRFKIVRELGRGGHGIVFLAIDPNLGRHVALKVPRPEALITTELRRRFLREAEAAGSLRHANLVTVYEVGEDGPLCYLVTEYCDGPTLAEWLKNHSDPIAPKTAAQLIATLSEGVAHAHCGGVLHRDIKPSNVLLESRIAGTSGDSAERPLSAFTPKLSDFGLAKLLVRPDDETRTGTLLGTPAYMAPEQAAGRLRDVCAATDVYGLGIILYEILVGKPPFRGENDPDTLRKVCVDEPMRPRRMRPGLPQDLEAICLRCLEKKHTNRYASAGELACDLRRFLAGEPTLARPATSWQRLLKWSQRRPAAAALVVVSFVALLLLSSGGWLFLVRTQSSLKLAEQRRVQAETSEQEMRRVLYASEVSRALIAWEANDPRSARHLLDTQIPKSGQSDLREFAWRYVWHLAHEERHILKGHESDVFRVRYSPDGTKLASASKDRTVRLWNASRGSSIGVLRGHSDEVLCVAFAPDGRQLASVGEDGKILLWDVDSLTLFKELYQDEKHLHCVCYSPDGSLLAAAGASGAVLLWQTSDWKRLPDLVWQLTRIEDLDFSLDSARLATACDNGAVCIWDPRSTRRLAELTGHREASGVSFFPDATRVVSVGRGDCSVQLWTVSTLPDNQLTTIAQPKPFLKYSEWLLGVTACRDNGAFIFASRDGVVQLVDVATQDVRQTFSGHTGRVWSVGISVDEEHVATSGEDSTVRIWSLDEDRAHRSFVVPGKIGAVYFPADNAPVAIQLSSHSDLFADLASRTGKISEAFTAHPTDPSHPEWKPHRLVALSQDAAILAVAFPMQTFVQLKNLSDGRDLKSIQLGNFEISDLALSSDGSKMAVVSTSGEIQIRDVELETILASLPAQDDTAKLPCFSPQGDKLAFAFDPLDCIAVWTVASQRPAAMLQQPEKEDSVGLLFSLDGKYLATRGSDRVVKFWDVESGKLAFSLSGHTGRVSSFAFSPDGRVFATGSVDCAIKLWDLSTRQLLATLHGHKAAVAGLFFRPDGNLLVSVGIPNPDHCEVHTWSGPTEHQIE